MTKGTEASHHANFRYLVGDRISVADILAACELEQPSMAGYDVTRDR